MKRRKDPLFQLASYNWLVDHQSMFPNSTFKILLLIFRQTFGFQKERDFIRYGYVNKKSKLGKNTISQAINHLIKEGFIERYDSKDHLLTKVKRGYRDKIFYRLTDKLYQEFEQYYNENWDSTVPKNGAVTIPKNGIYKEKALQTKLITKPTYMHIFNEWNSHNIVKHRALTPSIKKQISFKRQEGYSEDELIQAIRNYALILKDDSYFFKHKWTLESFLKNGGVEKFQDLEVAKINYTEEEIVLKKRYIPSNITLAKDRNKYDDIVER